MKNVFKGFQVSKMAVPKVQASSINKGFQTYHSVSTHSRAPGKPPAATKSPTFKGLKGIRHGIKGL